MLEWNIYSKYNAKHEVQKPIRRKGPSSHFMQEGIWWGNYISLHVPWSYKEETLVWTASVMGFPIENKLKVTISNAVLQKLLCRQYVFKKNAQLVKWH